MKWPDPQQQRPPLIAAAGSLPLRAVIALLEDSRSKQTRSDKQMRRDSFIQSRAFEYVLQRLVTPLYTAQGEGPHVVLFDHRSDIREFEDVYERGHKRGWSFPARESSASPRKLTSLRNRGFVDSLAIATRGPLIEIADLVVSAITRWADRRAAAHKGAYVAELSELDRDARSLIELFPVGIPDDPPRRRGYSIITHSENRTGRELLRDNIDVWAADLQSVLNLPVSTAPMWDDDIPF